MSSNSSTSGIRVFVYGTLKQGHVNHAALEGADFLGRCYLEDKYKMIDLGWYPAVVRGGNSMRRVFGEVYRVSETQLDSLDLIEGHPSYYERFKIETPWKNAWCYFLGSEYMEQGNDVDSGVWQPNKQELEFCRGCSNG